MPAIIVTFTFPPFGYINFIFIYFEDLLFVSGMRLKLFSLLDDLTISFIIMKCPSLFHYEKLSLYVLFLAT